MRRLLLILTLLFTASPVLALGPIVGSSCVITWRAPVTTATLQEYRLYLSKIPGSYDLTKPVGVPIAHPTTQATCQHLALTQDGQYYLVVTAVGQNGTQSDPSNEAPFMRDTTKPEPPQALTVGP